MLIREIMQKREANDKSAALQRAFEQRNATQRNATGQYRVRVRAPLDAY